MRLRDCLSLATLLLTSGSLCAEPADGLTLRVPGAEKQPSVTRPVHVELECRVPATPVALFVDDRVVLLTTRSRDRWELDPGKLLQGASGKRVKLRVTAFLADGKKLERSLILQVGTGPLQLEP